MFVTHAVNPWGMAWWRRQNESNVDLNRNWRRAQRPDRTPQRGIRPDPRDRVPGHLLEVPSIDDLMAAAGALVDEHGLAWVRDRITVGQHHHPDGLHFGGDRTEELRGPRCVTT